MRIETVHQLRCGLGVFGPAPSLTCMRGLVDVPDHERGMMTFHDSGERAYVFLGQDDELKATAKEHKDGSVTWKVSFRTKAPKRRSA